MASHPNAADALYVPQIELQPLDAEPVDWRFYPQFVIGELLKRGIGKIEADRAMERDGKVEFIFTPANSSATEVIGQLDVGLFRPVLARFGPRCNCPSMLYGGHTLLFCDYFRDGRFQVHRFSMFVSNIRNCGFWLRLYLYQIDDHLRPVFEPIQ
jgi:hypothetical protein